ncbi:hypothetical protein Syn6312_0503 [Synechococcus sp. PCC 6312]|nr:hypothetical protein Syn6312_0503 [Synechococcus sp. PCC 6312]
MSEIISLAPPEIDALDLRAVNNCLQAWLATPDITVHEQKLGFNVTYPRPPEEPDLELSELAPVRLWFIALDTRYPWLPFFLDWRNGELVRYAAMLIPHQFSRQQGIQFNPQGLDIFVMHKALTLWDWLERHKLPGEGRIRSLAEMFGYELDHDFFQVLRDRGPVERVSKE